MYLRLLVVVITLIVGCSTAKPPPYQRVIVLHGTPYEMGFQQGRAFKSEIRSIYTTLLTSSLLPYLNREQPDIASALPRYKEEKYANGRFSYEFLMDSARSLERYIPQEYIEEMHGIADGANWPYDRVLLANMLMDAMFNMRSITFFIRSLQAPRIVAIQFLGKDGRPLDHDGVDNDCDGQTDEGAEGIIDPDDPSPWALMTEVPPDGMVRFVVQDQVGISGLFSGKKVEPEGVDPRSIVFVYNGKMYTGGQAPGLRVRDGKYKDKAVTFVEFSPPGGFGRARPVFLQLQLGDRAWVTDPPPGHEHIMRDERITFTTRGYGKLCQEVPNIGYRDPRTQPPSIAFAVRGSATPDGRTRLAHNLAILDSNTMHKHTVVFFCRPKGGKPYMYLGWTGTVWGFSGMNSHGLAYAVNLSDTLNNGMVGEILKNLLDLKKARMEATGVPVGIVGRILLQKASSVSEAKELLKQLEPSYGWNFVLADAKGDFAVVEVHPEIRKKHHALAAFTVPPTGPNDLDPWGRPWASVGMDDIRAASHEVVLTEDIRINLFGAIKVLPQRFWTSFYFRSVRAWHILGQQIKRYYGHLDTHRIIEILREPDLVDQRDSMNSVVFEPQGLRAYVASGSVPSSDEPFVVFDLSDPSTWIKGGEGSVW